MTPCPSVEQLERLLAAQLEGATAEAVEQHVQACAACQQTLERLTAARLARTEQGQPRTSFLRQLENVLQGAAVTQRGNVINSCILLLSLKSFPSSLSGWFPS